MKEHIIPSSSSTTTTSALPPDLRGPMGPIGPVLQRLDPLLRTPVDMTENEFASLLDFVRNGLLDPEARPEKLRRLFPEAAEWANASDLPAKCWSSFLATPPPSHHRATPMLRVMCFGANSCRSRRNKSSNRAPRLG